MPHGVVEMPPEEYHASPALSSSFAKALTKYVPARARAEFQADRTSRSKVLGSAVHTVMLGDGPELAPIDGDGRTKAVKEAKAEAIAAGKQVVTSAEYEQITGMAKALSEHAQAHALLTSGAFEQSLFWEEDGVPCRARLDVLPYPIEGRRMLIPDLKTAAEADDWSFAKSIGDYGYHQQADWYCRGVRALGLDPDPEFLFVVVESKAPYLVNVCALNSDAKEAGRVLNDRAIRIFRDCTASGIWPGYDTKIAQLGPTPLYYTQHMEKLA